MAGKRYEIAGRTFFKVRNEERYGPRVHVVEAGNFWQGNKGWNHRAVCGMSVSGKALGPYVAPNVRVTCGVCRREVEAIKDGEEVSA